MLVVLDTNIIFPNFRFTGPEAQALLEACTVQEETDIQLGLSEIVIQEAISNYKKELSTCVEQSQKFINKARELIGSFPYPLTNETIEDHVAEYVSLLDSLAKSNGACLLAYPSIQPHAIVEREMSGKKPFGREEKSAYRDYLIWETILEVLRNTDQDVAFITNNHHDFAVGSSMEEQTQLHQDLVDDLNQNGINTNRLNLYSSLVRFNNEVTRPALDNLDPTYLLDARFDLSSEVESRTKSLLDGVWLDNEQVSLRPEYEDPHIVHVEEIESIKVTDLRRLPSNTLLVSIEADADCIIDTFVLKSEWYDIEERKDEELTDWDVDWNDTYVAVTIRKLIHISLSLTIDNKTGRWLSLETQPLTINGPIKKVFLHSLTNIFGS